jgi:hypothetical protein
VVNLADASGNLVASYSYDEFGVALSSSESFPGGWSNPYRDDGRDLARYDSETRLDWMSVRAYDPTQEGAREALTYCLRLPLRAADGKRHGADSPSPRGRGGWG